MMKYYMGYHNWHGQYWPITWMEEDGEPVGSRPYVQKEDKFEITESEFNSTLTELVRKYPRKIVEVVTTEVTVKLP